MKTLTFPKKITLLKLCIIIALFSGTPIARSNGFLNLIRNASRKEKIIQVVAVGQK